MNSKLRIAGALAIIILIGFSIWRGSNKSGDSDASPSPIVAASPLLVAFETPGKDWVSYASPSAGFALSYPSDWAPASCGPRCVMWAPKNQPEEPLMGITIVPGKLEDLLAQAKAYTVATSTTQVGSLTWTHLTLQAPDNGAVITSHLVQRGDRVFEFGTDATGGETLSRYGSIIRSFRFTK